MQKKKKKILKDEKLNLVFNNIKNNNRMQMEKYAAEQKCSEFSECKKNYIFHFVTLTQ